MTQELSDLLDARKILSRAYFDTIGIWAAHTIVWHAIEYVDRQTAPLIEAGLKDEEEAAR